MNMSQRSADAALNNVLNQDNSELSLDNAKEDEDEFLEPAAFELDTLTVEAPIDDVNNNFQADYGQDLGTIFVSAETLTNEKQRFEDFVRRVVAAEGAVRKAETEGSTPKNAEKVMQLRQIVAKLYERLKPQAEYIDLLRVKNESDATTNEPCWQHLYEGLNRHHSSFSNKTLAEFYLQKTSIIDGLKCIYEPLKTRPKVEETADQPAALKVPLLKHQKHALKWLQWREAQKINGGILADDMGLGKTLTMIALILASKANAKPTKLATKVDKHDLAWQKRMEALAQQQRARSSFKFFDDSDDENDDVPLAKLCKNEIKVPFFEQKFEYNRCDTLLQRGPAGTLVICPASVMHQWANEIETKVEKETLNYLVYHGTNRNASGVNKLKIYDIVITSYNIVVSELRHMGTSSWLFAIEWTRIILDEAHIIRNTKTACCMSVCKLRSKNRWALTGTPIQNRALDAFALLQFLGVPQFTHLQQWNKWLNEGMEGHCRLSFLLKPLILRRTKLQLQANGDMPDLPELQIKLIEVELSDAEMAVYQVLSAISVKIFAQFLQQHEKRNEDLNYYTTTERPRFMRMQIDPKYEELYERFLRSLGYDPREKVRGIVILVLLLRLRQFCCHPGLMVAMLCGQMTAEEVGDIRHDAKTMDGQLQIDVLQELDHYAELQAKQEEEEEIKILPIEAAVKLEADIKAELQAQVKLEENLKLDADVKLEADVKQEADVKSEAAATPNCSQMTSGLIDLVAAVKLLQPTNPIFDFNCHSSKMLKIFSTLEQILNETNDKVIVVSQWTSYLAIIKQFLTQRYYETLDFNGKLDVYTRLEVLKEFNSLESDKRILLLSLTAGGVGLNLNVANHLLLIDLHWNPQLERQAQDRIYRYGQHKPTFVYRFMCRDTVEQRIKALQEYKLEIAKVVLNHDQQASGKGGGNGLSLNEMKKLFGL